MLDDIYEVRRKNVLSLQKQFGLDRKDLAEKIGLSYALMSHYIGKTPTKRIGDSVARRTEVAFNKPEGYLDQNMSASVNHSLTFQSDIARYGQQSLLIEGVQPTRLVPVLSWVQAGNWTPAIAATEADATEWLPWYPTCGKNGFALIVSGESMLPDFQPDDRIYVNPDCEVDSLRTGDLVVVFCDEDGTATFKRLVVEPNNMHLEPLNPKYKDDKKMSLKYGCRLIGKVVGMHRYI